MDLRTKIKEEFNTLESEEFPKLLRIYESNPEHVITQIESFVRNNDNIRSIRGIMSIYESDLETKPSCDKENEDEDYCSVCGSPKLSPKDKCKVCKPDTDSNKSTSTNSKYSFIFWYKLGGMYMGIRILVCLFNGSLTDEKLFNCIVGGLGLIGIVGFFHIVFILIKSISFAFTSAKRGVPSNNIPAKRLNNNVFHLLYFAKKFLIDKFFLFTTKSSKVLKEITKKIQQEKIILLKAYLLFLTATCLYVPWYTYSVLDYAKIPTSLGYKFLFTPPCVSPIQYGIVDVNRIILEIIALTAVFLCLYLLVKTVSSKEEDSNV